MRQFAGICLFTIVAFSAPVSMAAESVSYNYVDAGYVNFEPDNAADDFSGLGLRGSYLLNQNIFLTGEFNSTSMQSIDRADIAFGAGYRSPINEKSDFFGQLEYVTVDVDPNFDEDGFRLTGGVRVMMSDRFELRGALQYVDIENSDTVLNIGAEYNFASNVAGFFELREGDEYGGYFIGARYEF